jgi:glucose/arabinose dehydrogenase
VALGAPTAAHAHAAHCSEPPPSQLEAPGLRLTPVARLGAVTSIAAPPGDRRRVYVAERRGTVRVLVDGRLRREPLIDLSAEIEPTLDYEVNERGLQSIAFARDFRRSRRFYAFHSDARGDARVAEFVDRPGAPPRGRTLLTLRHDFAPQHYGGQLAVGPRGRLYVSFGEAMRADLAQEPGFYGKIVRLDPRRPRRARVIAMGLRNPYRFSLDRPRRRLIVVDNGDARYDEIDLLPLGSDAVVNFGWPLREGPYVKNGRRIANYAGPALALRQPLVTALIGGLVVRDGRLPALRGRYLFGDFCDGWLATTNLDARRPAVRREGPVVPLLTAFGADARRRVYAASHGGELYRLDPAVR